MLVGWLQGKRILDMFTIGVRYGLTLSTDVVSCVFGK